MLYIPSRHNTKQHSFYNPPGILGNPWPPGIKDVGNEFLSAQETMYFLQTSPATPALLAGCRVAAANNMEVHRIVPRGIHCDKIGFKLNSVRAGHFFQWAIYDQDPTTGLPRNFRLGSGPVSIAGPVGAYIIAVDYTYLYGDWIAIACTDASGISSINGTSVAEYSFINQGFYRDSTNGTGLTFNYGAYLRGYPFDPTNQFPVNIFPPLPTVIRWDTSGLGANQISIAAHWDIISRGT